MTKLTIHLGSHFEGHFGEGRVTEKWMSDSESRPDLLKRQPFRRSR